VTAALNQQFRIADRVRFVQGRGALTQVQLQYANATASLYLQGAHIDSYKPNSAADLLWLSQSSKFEQGQPIRGGIPICWPWFGAPAQSTQGPQHGFARISEFDVVATNADANCTQIILQMRPAEPFPEWQGKVRLEVEVRLSGQLWIELRTKNIGTDAREVGAALHTYFSVSNVLDASISELTGLDYKDKVQNFSQHRQTQDLVVDSEVDRIYLEPPTTVHLLDPLAARSIAIQAWGNTDLVVWNPGKHKAAEMPDFDDDGYNSMLCIEPANALDNTIFLEPGQVHSLGKTIALMEPC